jgi:hypothetical protein
MSVSHPHSAAIVGGNDAPLINARAETRGRIATEGGDERAWVRSALLVRAPDSGTGSRREHCAAWRPLDDLKPARRSPSRRTGTRFLTLVPPAILSAEQMLALLAAAVTPCQRFHTASPQRTTGPWARMPADCDAQHHLFV